MNCSRCDTSLAANVITCPLCGEQVDTPAPPPGSWKGSLVDDRYLVHELVGRGGMGEVYRVEHVRMGKVAAMKILRPDLAREPEVVARFHREAEAVSKLDHHHTVEVFDFGEHDGSLYLVMQYVRGETLASLVPDDEPMPWRRALAIVVQMCLALEEAHARGIVHRDVKPENVLVTRGTDDSDFVKMLDFGLAQFRERDQVDKDITAKGTVVGTPYVMAPEQIQGQEVDHRADVYGAGATIYLLLTGQTPYEANSPMGVLTRALTDRLVPPGERCPGADIPPDVEAVVMRAMAKDKEQRFATMRDMRKALVDCLSGKSSGVAAPTEFSWHDSTLTGILVAADAPFSRDGDLRRKDLDRFEHSLKRRRVLLAAIPLLLLALVGAGVAAWFLWPRPKPPGLRVEREPNNRLDQANLIGRNRSIRGQIGKRLSDTKGDVDVYRFEVEAKGPVLLSARLSALPLLNTSLQIYDARFKELVAVDSARVRGAEVLPNLVVPPGRYFAVVQEVATGASPSTNINDSYHLTVNWRPLKAEDEVEPNDAVEQANRIRPGETVVGFLGRPDDVDVFRPLGKGGGSIDVFVSGIPEVDCRIRVIELGRATPPTGAAADGANPLGFWMRRGWVADGGGPGASERLTAVPWPAGRPAPLVLVERKPPEGGLASGHPGLDRPYKLMLSFRAGPVKKAAPRPTARRARPAIMRPWRPPPRRRLVPRPRFRPVAPRPPPAMIRPVAPRPPAPRRPPGMNAPGGAMRPNPTTTPPRR